MKRSRHCKCFSPQLLLSLHLTTTASSSSSLSSCLLDGGEAIQVLRLFSQFPGLARIGASSGTPHGCRCILAGMLTHACLLSSESTMPFANCTCICAWIGTGGRTKLRRPAFKGSMPLKHIVLAFPNVLSGLTGSLGREEQAPKQHLSTGEPIYRSSGKLRRLKYSAAWGCWFLRRGRLAGGIGICSKGQTGRA